MDNELKKTKTQLKNLINKTNIPSESEKASEKNNKASNNEDNTQNGDAETAEEK